MQANPQKTARTCCCCLCCMCVSSGAGRLGT